MQTALTAPALELDLGVYNALSAVQKALVAQDMLDGTSTYAKPYLLTNIQSALNEAITDLVN